MIIYEDFFERIINHIIAEINYNYDYYYLKHALERAKEDDIDTIITGSSYGLFGIDRSKLTSEVNLCLQSKDLYYSIKEIEEICEKNNNIHNIVLCCNYYIFYFDLSKCQGEELSRISKVYFPLFNDLHNASYVPCKTNFLCESNIVDVDRIMQLHSLSEYEKFYFNETRNRKEYALKMWEDKSKTWLQLSEEERILAGRIRAEGHNNLIKHQATFKENYMMFEKISQYCEKKKINLIAVVTPISKYYRDVSLEKFKDDFYTSLNEISGTVHVVDLYDDESFDIIDYNDMDHLSEIGAEKFTQLVLEVIERINSAVSDE